MTVSILLGLLGGVLTGILLIALGWRGKRLNDHPTCRDCGFDLIGVPEETITCPECGAGLRRPNAVRKGQRRKRPVVMAVGAVGAAFPLLLIGALLFAMLSGIDVDRRLPVGVLLWQARHGNAQRSAQAAKEFVRRQSVKELSPGQRDTVVQAALDLQGDLSRPWSPEWGDLIEDARLDRKLSGADLTRFREQAAVLDWKVRDRIGRDGPLPVLITLKEARVGSQTTLYADASLETIKVDGMEEPNLRASARKSAVSHASPYGGETFQLVGGQSQWARFGATPMGELTFAIDTSSACLDLGRHSVELSISLRYETPDQTGAMQNTSTTPSAATRTFSRSVSVSVLPPAGAVDLVPSNAQTEDLLRKALNPRSEPGISREANTTTLRLSVGDLPVPVAFRVFARYGTKTCELGRFSSGLSVDKGDEQILPWARPDEHERAVTGSLKGIEWSVKQVELVLRPDTDTAANTVDVTRIYNGELVFKDFEVTRMPGSGISLFDIFFGH